MKKLFILIIIVVGFQQVSSQNVSEKDSLEISEKINDWNKAWKIKDANLAAKWYSDNADFTNAFGFSMIGKNEIEPYLTRVFGFDFVMAGNSQQTSLKFKKLSINSILVITTIERKGQKTSDGNELGTRNTTHYRIFQKNDSWEIIAHLISDARSIETEKH